jgi:tetratricopeptide (TPR) repeat protein
MEEVTIGRQLRKLILKPMVAVSLAVLCAAGMTAEGQSAGEKALLAKAQSLEQSGHIDLAAQTWQQVLLSDPNNQEALAGLGRWAKLSGNDAEAERYIDRLRQVNPTSPEIARIEALVSNKTQNELLQQAAELARNGHNQQALKIYRETFGVHPPDNWALAYYDTEAGIPATRQDAIDGLRGLMEKYPSDSQYAIDLGRILTYDPRTRGEGERILSQYPQDAAAQMVLRQALEWDVQNPASEAEIRQFLREHPDQDLAKELLETEERQAKAASGLARTPAEQAAFRALAANHLNEAESRLMALHARQPDNPRVLAGLAFLRMKQSNFRGAVEYFEQAEKNGLHGVLIAGSLATSRFWDAMQEGTQAMNGNRPEEAVREYRIALALQPRSMDAQMGLAGAYMKMQQPAQAVPVYEELVRKQRRNGALWRGLFMAEAQAGQAKAALATARQFSPALTSTLAKDPDYLRTLASAYVLLGDDRQGQKILLQALSLRYPPSLARVKSEIMLQYAALLIADRDYPRAAAVYRTMLRSDPENVNAWQGMVSLEHVAGRDADAIAMVERMPPEAYDNALRDSGFLTMLAAIYQGQNHPDVAEQFLERAVKLYEDNGQPLPIPLQLQVAAVDLQRNHPEGAYRIYRSVLTQHPNSLDGWKGLLAALDATGHDADGLAQIQQIPPQVRQELEQDVAYQQTVAAIYAANGQQQAALGMLARVRAYYRDEQRQPPAAVDIQDAWVLLNTGDDRDLYQQLMTLGDRTDMSDEERRQVQMIWASWAQRRAAEAAAAGNPRRGVEILTAAARAFPGNPAVSKALAVGYFQAGQPKDAMAIYLAMDMNNATASDYQSMVGTALAVQNMRQAEAWLRAGLEKFPDDPQVLAAAARFEQARGDHQKAADYWKASLQAMPPVPPSTELAHRMDEPDQTGPTKRMTPSDLVSLLKPQGEDADEFSGVPLPSYRNPNPTMTANNAPYGPDPYYMGTAPVPMNSAGSEGANPLGATPAQGVASPGSAGTGAANPVPTPEKAAPMAVVPPAEMQSFTPGAAPDLSAPAGSAPGAETTPNPLSVPNQAGQAEQSGEAQQKSESKRKNPSKRKPAAVHPYIPQAELTAPATSATTQATSASEAAPETLPQHRQLPSLNAEAQTTDGTIAQEPPEELTLDTSPALTPLPNANDAAQQRATAALAAAQKPVDPSLAQTEYETPAQEIAQNEPEPEPQVYQRPSAGANSAQQSNASGDSGQSNSTTPGASDGQLRQENLPPLKGPYARPAVVRQQDLRQEAQQQIANIQAGYSPWEGGTGLVDHRSGTAGFDALTALEAPFETSMPLGTVARLTVIARPVFLDAGAPSMSPILPGGVVEQLGTAPTNTILSQQNAVGIGGEVQLATSNFAVSAGYSPYGFLVSNVIARMNWKPANGPFIFNFTRDTIKDSQLSYSGLRDPGSAGPSYPGNIWGGVVSTGAEVQFGKGYENGGYYVSGGGQYIDGAHVQTNTRVDGDAGAYWRVQSVQDEGNLTVGVNFFGMHYAHNSDYFTYGHGGYFSPQAYFLGNVPISWTGQYGLNWHYTVVGAFGVQAFQQQSVPFFPLDSLLQTVNNNPYYAAQTVVSGNYDFHSEVAYHLTDHWYAGAFLSMNNTRSYNTQTVGFYVRFLIRPQISTENANGPTGLYPWDGLRPYLAP